MNLVPSQPPSADYSSWSPDQLLERVVYLEHQLKEVNGQLTAAKCSSMGGLTQPPKPARSPRAFDQSKYSTRLIALKFAYLGQNYNGFEHHSNNTTPLPTVEEVVWKALVKARLIFPTMIDGEHKEVNWDGTDYSKCGRTDRGVSAFGQVIGIRVRSNRPPDQRPVVTMELDAAENVSTTQPISNDISQNENEVLLDVPALDGDSATSLPIFDDIHDEIPYPQILNRLLPPDIRVLAWCPSPPSNFSARFLCRERRYRYFFTQPAFNPTPGAPGMQQSLTKDRRDRTRRDGWLDIEAMKAAAKKYEGSHDFRNLCKVDASKQLDNFMRRIYLSEIREVTREDEPAAYVAGNEFSEFSEAVIAHRERDGSGSPYAPRIYQFVLHGSAFLWHQVRHMVAILFLVGQGLESPSIVDELLDIDTNPCKPNYEMAEDVPLVLWDCIFPEEGSGSPNDSLHWVWVGSDAAAEKQSARAVKNNGKFGGGGVVDELWKLWRRRRMDEILAGSLLNLAAHVGGVQAPTSLQTSKRGETSRYVYMGGDAAQSKGKYVPVMQKKKSEPVDIINARYRQRKGIEQSPRISLLVERRENHND